MRTKLYLSSAESHHSVMNDMGIIYRGVDYAYINTFSTNKINNMIKDWRDRNVRLLITSSKDFTNCEHFLKDTEDLIDYVIGDIECNSITYKLWNTNPMEWDNICQKYKYVALPQVDGIAIMISIARRYGCRVHGLSITNFDILNHSPLDSCNSSAWTSGSRYGSTQVWDKNKLTWFDKTNKSIRSDLKDICDIAGIDHAKYMSDDIHTVDLFQLYNWKLMQEYLVQKEYDIKAKKVDYDNDTETDSFDVLPLELAVRTDKKELTSKVTSNKQYCNICSIKGVCVNYKENSDCYFIASKEINSSEDIVNSFLDVLNIQYARIQRATLFESMSGGTLSRELSKEIQTFSNLVKQVQEMGRNKDMSKIIITGKAADEVSKTGVIPGFASQENPKKEGILSKLFGKD